MAFIERDSPEMITSTRVALARVTIALGAACEHHDLEGYDGAIRETAFAALVLAHCRQIHEQPGTFEAEKELQSCSDLLTETNSAYMSSDYPGAKRALSLASLHLDRYLQVLGPQFADLRDDLLPLITPPSSEESQH